MIIGLRGDAGSGKDTVGDELVHEYGFTRISFADELKRNVSQAFNVPLDHFYDRVLKEAEISHLPLRRNTLSFVVLDGISPLPDFFTPRLLCIYYANCMRHVDPQYWVRIPLKNLKSSVNYVITDVRYQNEVDAVKKLGGVTVKIERQGTNSLNHISERGLDGVEPDHYLKNEGTKEELFAKVKGLIKKIGAK